MNDRQNVSFFCKSIYFALSSSRKQRVFSLQSLSIRREVSRKIRKTKVLILLFKRQSSHRYDESRRRLENAWNSIEESKKKILKNRKIDVKRDLQNCMYEIRIDFDEKKHRTKINREFQKLIVNYNNVLFFCNEIVNVNFKHSDWATFRVMKDIKHTLDSVMTNEENRFKFCQIYQIDQSQKTLDRRMKNDIDDNVLNWLILRQLQRLMRKINFYVQAYKVVDQRILNFEHSLVEFQLKQYDLNR